MKLAISVVLVIAALAVGFVVGKLPAGGQPSTVDRGALAQVEQRVRSELDGMRKQIADLAARIDRTDLSKAEVLMKKVDEMRAQYGGLRMAYIRSPEEIMIKYKGTQEALAQFREERDKAERELEKVRRDFEVDKTITARQYEEQVTQLQARLKDLDDRLTSAIVEKIVQALEKVGQESTYDIVFKRKDVVLFSKLGLFDDITEKVIDIMNQTLDTEKSSRPPK